MDFILINWKEILTAVLSILGTFSIIAKLTPNTTDDKVVNFLLKIVNVFGLTKK
jgi:hypothetical protein